MGLRAGALRERITIERASAASNDYNEEVLTWATLATVRAQVLYGTGRERREAAQEVASVPATFRVRQSSDSASWTPKDRILFAGAAWDIVSNVPIGRDGREITAVRQA